MGCCLGKYGVDHTGATGDGKPEIKLLTSADDETTQQRSADSPTSPERTATFTALYDYISRNAQDLSFKKWDQFILQSKMVHDDWWFVKNRETGEQGYAPKNFIAAAGTLQTERWFFGTLTRKDSERLLLKAGKKGCFLIRESETAEDSYSLSLLNEDEQGFYAKHYRIRRNEQGAFYITGGLEFTDLPSLVKYYHDDSHGLCCQLVEPCSIRDVPQTYSLAPRIFRIEEKQFKMLNEMDNNSSETTRRALWNQSLAVAVKNYASETNPSVNESLKKLHHKSIVKFFGEIATEPFSLCWEYLSGGSLSSYLKSPKNADLTLVDLIDTATQVATGMAYLESFNIPHKCLRSRHVMVGEGPVFKVTDYSVYGSPMRTDKDTFLWMSPEAIQNGVHDLKSDVWSFGVLSMEIVTKCEMPVKEQDAEDFLETILSGHRMPRYGNCPDSLYDLLLQCWNKECDLRPTFEYIQIFLENFFQRNNSINTAKVDEMEPDG